MKRLKPLVCVLLLLVASPSPVRSQPVLFPGPGQNQGFNNGRGLNGGPNGNGQNPNGQQGGGADADFESLIDLIVSTVNPDSWAENGGGEAEIRPFVGGVYADATGLLRRVRLAPGGSLEGDLAAAHARLEAVGRRAAAAPVAGDSDPRGAAALRCVSLTRLERELDRRLATGEPVEEAMLTLAGLRRVRYVLFVPGAAGGAPAEVVLAGAAGDWRVVGDGRIVATDSGQSIVRLDDLLTLLRRVWGDQAGPFGCSINPRPEALADTQAFLNASAKKPVAPRRRDAWLNALRDKVGVQDIDVFGVDPESRVAGVLVEADHHMKLIGMGLEEGVVGVRSYLDGMAARPEDPAASTGVLRWWFAMNYSSIHASPDGRAFEIIGPGVKVMSEKELLTERGQRAAAGEADVLAEQFPAEFTHHFDALCRKHPIYSELRAAFDLSLAIEIIRGAGRAGVTGWRPGLLVSRERLPLPAYEPASTVETVVNHRVVNRRRFVAGVSGGVWGDARRVLGSRQQTVQRSGYGPLGAEPIAPPSDLDSRQWWWDLER